MVRTIAITDDYPLYAEGLKRIINEDKLFCDDYQALYTVQNGRELQEQFADPSRIPDIVLLDVMMPVMNGIETAMWLTQHHPNVLVLVLSMVDDEDVIGKMVRSGIRGYLLKNSEISELRKALDFLAEEKYYYSSWITHNVFKVLHKEKEPHVSGLELEFIRLAASGLTSEEIAGKMFKSPRTVEDYRRNLCERFGLKTRLELVLYALKVGIITLEDVKLRADNRVN